MTKIIKYVVVNKSGTYLAKFDSIPAANEVIKRNARNFPRVHLHVEKWTYPVNPDGTHGDPVKQMV